MEPVGETNRLSNLTFFVVSANSGYFVLRQWIHVELLENVLWLLLLPTPAALIKHLWSVKLLRDQHFVNEIKPSLVALRTPAWLGLRMPGIT